LHFYLFTYFILLPKILDSLRRLFNIFVITRILEIESETGNIVSGYLFETLFSDCIRVEELCKLCFFSLMESSAVLHESCRRRRRPAALEVTLYYDCLWRVGGEL